MKRIEIAEQPRLSFARTVLITITGIRYRLFRALVTVAVIAVAVAFLMNILSEGLIKRAVGRHTSERIRRMHLVHHWAARLVRPGTREDILAELAAAEEGDARLREIERLSGLAPAAPADLCEAARQAMSYLAFFDDLDYARRRTLVHTATGTGIFDRLQQPTALDEFGRRLAVMRSVRLPGTLAEFSRFLNAWPDIRSALDRIAAGYATAAREVAAALADRTVFQALAHADEGFGDAVRRAGFEFDRLDVQPLVQRQAQRMLETRAVERTIELPAARRALAQWHNKLPADVTMKMLWETFATERAAAWYLKRLEDAGMPMEGITPARLAELARIRDEEQALARAERLTVGVGTGRLGLGRRMFWLVLVSMLVCVIGISNAMLMSVTERFREIATMKCLGAMDSFIMVMFVLESCLMGVVGGCIGGAFGTLLGLGRMALAFGAKYALAVPVGELIAALLAATVTGVLLAAIAAVYPAFRAARLAPMEAMRIE